MDTTSAASAISAAANTLESEEAAVTAAEAAVLAKITPPPGVIRLIARAQRVAWASSEGDTSVRCVYLCGNLHRQDVHRIEPSPIRWINGREQNAGSYDPSEWALVLLRDGTYEEWTVGEGSWSQWQGAESNYRLDRRRLSLADVVAEYDLDNVLGALAEAYQAAAAATEERARLLASRRARLARVLAAL